LASLNAQSLKRQVETTCETWDILMLLIQLLRVQFFLSATTVILFYS
jgi:hypothetical protein